MTDSVSRPAVVPLRGAVDEGSAGCGTLEQTAADLSTSLNEWTVCAAQASAACVAEDLAAPKSRAARIRSRGLYARR